MRLRKYLNQTNSSGNPSSLTNMLPGGNGSIVTGTTGVPMLSSPQIEVEAMEVMDVTASGSTPTPAKAGKLLVMDPTVATIGAGGGAFRQSASAAAAIGRNKCGVVTIPGQASEATAASGTSNGTKATIIVDGPVMAYCTTDGTHPISAGSLLVADGSGNLTTNGTQVAGTVLAVAAGALAISQPATLVPVVMGGF